MDLNNYEDLLERALEKIPDNVKQSSRFEIPDVEVRFQGKNTYVINFHKIINALNRDPSHFTGIFLKSAGTMGKVQGQQLFLKGRIKEKVLNKLIENYTKTYVLCNVCNKPDTELQKEGKKQYLKCTACGARQEIKE